MKVLLTKAFFPSDIEYIKQRINPEIEIVIPENFMEDTIAELSQGIDVLLGGLITEKILKNAFNLKFIQIPWTGVENVDFELVNKYQIIVCNSHSNSRIVAEHAIALMFDASKKIAYHDRLMRKGNWNRPGINQNSINAFSRTIFGSKVAIIGFGSIGRNIYKLLSGFDCDFKIFDKYLDELLIESKNITFFSMESLSNELDNIDYLFLCIPLTAETKGIINSDFFPFLNKKCILINTSRGEIINEDDLFNALKMKNICFAAIDTWYNYPNKQNPIVYPSIKNDFHTLDNLILSPHRAGFVEEGFPHLDDAIENLNRYSSGKNLINMISAQKEF
jgi:phosphoglycerate dehydrogenase-like enzyme